MADTSPSIPQPSTAARPWVRVGNVEDAIKRLFDIIVSAVGIILLAPVFAYVAYRIQRDTPGPVFYYGPRLGRDGKPFQIMKFRTMYELPASYAGPRITAEDDERVTPYGRWLRDTKLNELPQLINVLRGQMSLVGPRPEDPNIAAAWDEPAKSEILALRPGITSPASVVFRDEEGLLKNSSLMDTYLDEIAPDKLRLDQLYAHHHSFWGDMDILLWTTFVLLPRVGNYTPPEARLFVGPLNKMVHRYANWFIVDTVVTIIAMGIVGVMWRSFGPLDIGLGLAAALALGFAVLFSLVNVALGVNRIAWRQAAVMDSLELLPGVAIAAILFSIANYLYPPAMMSVFYRNGASSYLARPLLPFGLIILTSGLAYMGFVIMRFRTRLITALALRWMQLRGSESNTRERILIVGGGESGRFAAWLLNQGRYANIYRVIGFVDDDYHKQAMRIQGVNVLGGRGDITRLVAQHDIGILVFAIHNITAHERAHLMNICKATGARLLFFPDIPANLEALARSHTGPASEDAPAPQPEWASEYLPVSDWVDDLTRVEACLAQDDLTQAQAQLSGLRAKLEACKPSFFIIPSKKPKQP